METFSIEQWSAEGCDPSILREHWTSLSQAEQTAAFKALHQDDVDDFFLALTSKDQCELIVSLPPRERTAWMRILAPDDAADVLQLAPGEERAALISLLDEHSKKEVCGLMAYSEDAAGGLMSPRYARVRPEMTSDEAISYLRKQARTNVETLRYSYVIDAEQRLLGVISFRQLFGSTTEKTVAELMKTNLIRVLETDQQEQVSKLFIQSHLMALPVVDQDGRMKGIVTTDDIVDVLQEEATEDIQKLGGMEALDEPYLEIGFGRMVKKRAGWLAVLFVGEMLTATAMGFFEKEIEKAVILALFVPLIISSGGNSGSQASTLVVRALALGELSLRDWARVVRRELLAGLVLGAILAALGLTRILLWQAIGGTYGAHYLAIAFTVSFSLMGVVMFGTLTGSVLPLVLRRVGFDPASASAPFVATMVDVTGLVIYFTVASVIFDGSLA